MTMTLVMASVWTVEGMLLIPVMHLVESGGFRKLPDLKKKLQPSV